MTSKSFSALTTRLTCLCIHLLTRILQVYRTTKTHFRYKNDWNTLQHLVRIMTILCRRVVITAVTLQATTAFRHKCSLQGLTRTQLTKTIILSCSQILQPRLHRGGEGRGGKAAVEPLPCLQPVPRGADLSGGGGGGGRGGGGGGRGQRALHHLWGTGRALTFLPHLYICYTIHNIPLIL